MKLNPCPDCKKEISQTAESCPDCGCDMILYKKREAKRRESRRAENLEKRKKHTVKCRVCQKTFKTWKNDEIIVGFLGFGSICKSCKEIEVTKSQKPIYKILSWIILIGILYYVFFLADL